MKDRALEIAQTGETELQQVNYLREYLQHIILREMFERDWLDELVFHGGTGLRMVHDLNRFSEDLDFHLHQPQRNYTIQDRLEQLKQDLALQGYRLEVKPSPKGNVKSAMLKFNDLLYESGISHHENEKLKIKLEIDVNPPVGFHTQNHPVSRYINFVVTTHDLPSFLAGKCHAVLQRTYAKGRDYFDLLYYLNKWDGITPNLSYLNNALDQTGYDGPEITESNWRENLLNRVKQVDWSEVESDVEPFLLSPSDIKAFRKEFLIKALEEE